MWGRSNSNMKVGWSVAQDGPYQAAGAPGDESNRGAVYVKEASETVYAGRGFVLEPDTSSGSLLGTAVALAWPFLAVGAPGRGAEGAAFLYQYNQQSNSWDKLGDRIDPAAVALSIPSFGRSVAVMSGMVLVGGGGSALLQYLAPAPVIHTHSLWHPRAYSCTWLTTRMLFGSHRPRAT